MRLRYFFEEKLIFIFNEISFLKRKEFPSLWEGQGWVEKICRAGKSFE
jgi:hypothetical protein